MKLSIYFWILTAVSIIISIITQHDIAYLLSASLIFSFFDSIGWKYIIKDIYNEKNNSVIIYRIIQTIFQCLLIWILYVIGGWIVALIFLINHFAGIHDLMYYMWLYNGKYYLRDAVKSEKTIHYMPWLWWTYFGWFGKEYQNNIYLVNFSISFYIISCIILLFI